MGFRVRKSFKIAPGVRVNVGKKSAGVSFGTRGARVSVNSRTGARATVGIPGSGISYTTSLNSSKKKKSSSSTSSNSCYSDDYSSSSRKNNTSAYKRNAELKEMEAKMAKLEQLQKNQLEVEMYENSDDYSSSSRKNNTSAYKRNAELKEMEAKMAKLEQLQKNQLEVEMYENRLDMIQAIHKECDDDFNWSGIAQTPPPFDLPNGEIGENERRALSDLENYKPSFFDRLSDKDSTKRAELQKAVFEAKEKDKSEYEEWKSLNLLANEVLNRNDSLYLPIIEEMQPFDDLLEFGSGFEFFIYEPDWLEIDFDVNAETVVPKEIKSLTKTGKVSTKQMPKGKYFEIQQDYICSCVIRMARDMFALLPIDYVVINALDNRLDTATGINKKDFEIQQDYICSCVIRMARDMFALLPIDYVVINALDNRLDTATGINKKEVILSVKIEKEKLYKMNLDLIDPSDSMDNFECNMNFKKLSGLQEVDRLIERDEN